MTPSANSSEATDSSSPSKLSLWSFYLLICGLLLNSLLWLQVLKKLQPELTPLKSPMPMENPTSKDSSNSKQKSSPSPSPSMELEIKLIASSSGTQTLTPSSKPSNPSTPTSEEPSPSPDNHQPTQGENPPLEPIHKTVHDVIDKVPVPKVRIDL